MPFMKLWEPWNFNSRNVIHTVYTWSMQTFLLLIQLFKQEEGEAIDVHSFTCLKGIGDRIFSNYKMNYSWEYAYRDEETEDPDKRIGPKCQRPICPQSEGDINTKLEQLGKTPFIVDSESFNEMNRYPKLSQIIYNKVDNEKININRSYIVPRGITVKCNNRPEITRKLICKYYENAIENLNYDESIIGLNPSECYDEQVVVDQSVEVDGSVEVEQTTKAVCGVHLGRFRNCLLGQRC